MRTAQEAVKDSSSFCWNFHKCSLYLLATFDKESSPAAFNTSFATAEKFNSLLASVLKTGRTATGTQFPPSYQCCKRCWMEYLQTEGEMVLILNDWIILFYLYVPLLLVSFLQDISSLSQKALWDLIHIFIFFVCVAWSQQSLVVFDHQQN